MFFPKISTPAHLLKAEVLPRVVFLLLVLCTASIFTTLPSSAIAKTNLPYILVDETSGTILQADNENARWYPASLTKLMTAWVTFRAIADGEVQPGSPVEISKQAALQPPTKMGFKVGTRLRIDTALKIVVIKSANDVSRALAEAIAGTEPAFVKRMNAEAKRLGMINTHYANSNGLHSTKQYTTARDTAVLIHNIRTKFPQYADWFSTPAIQYGEKKYYSFNLLLERFPGTTGMKTGYVCASGYNLAATATRNGKSLITVVFGRSSQTDRAVSAAKLLTEGFEGTTQGSANVYDLPTGPSAEPVNMRSQLCTEAAQKTLYNPLPENAVIKSQYLEPRKSVVPALKVVLGDVDAPPSKAFAAREFLPGGNVPVPQKRPQHVITDVDGKQIDTAKGIPSTLRSGKPIPSQKPQALTTSQ